MMTQFPISITLNSFYFEPLKMDLVLGLHGAGIEQNLVPDQDRPKIDTKPILVRFRLYYTGPARTVQS